MADGISVADYSCLWMVRTENAKYIAHRGAALTQSHDAGPEVEF